MQPTALLCFNPLRTIHISDLQNYSLFAFSFFDNGIYKECNFTGNSNTTDYNCHYNQPVSAFIYDRSVLAINTVFTVDAILTVRTCGTGVALVALITFFSRSFYSERNPSCAIVVRNLPLVCLCIDTKLRGDTVFSVLAVFSVTTIGTVSTICSVSTLNVPE